MNSKWAMVAPIITIGIGMVFGFGMGLKAGDQVTENQIVSSFNDGFMDGSCHNGEDGFGNPCYNYQG